MSDMGQLPAGPGTARCRAGWQKTQPVVQKSQQVVRRKKSASRGEKSASRNRGKLSESWTSCIDTRYAAAMKDTHTPPRSLRVPDELWDAAKEKAAEKGETITDVLTRALRRYIRP